MHTRALLYIVLIIGSRGESTSSVNANLFTYPLPTIISSTCPSQKDIETLHKHFNEKFTGPCSCGDASWTRVAYLNMSDPQQTCPSNWNLITSPVRGCGQSFTARQNCDSVFYPVKGRHYSSVCGKIIAFHKGVFGGFSSVWSNRAFTIEETYVAGVSLTHGPPGARQHVWTFVGTISEIDNTFNGKLHCPCSNNDNWTYEVPSFIGNDYFCDTGNRGPGYSENAFYLNDPLWDGEGCGSTSSCCQFNSPPWFCKSLPRATTDDLEIRLCYINPFHQGAKIISSIDIYIR